MKKRYAYRDKKIMTMKIVADMTGLSERKIRYYETKKLIFPARTPSSTQRYSFSDIETLMDIAEKIEEGVLTREIRDDFYKRGKGIRKANKRL
ncbi:MerR family transcriptional regulator [Priestia megaterium]|uniref:MerR family transcriptional regulator n=1 Tax=Priestia megaterium TaxID=1404 RepID=UPI003D024938